MIPGENNPGPTMKETTEPETEPDRNTEEPWYEKVDEIIVDPDDVITGMQRNQRDSDKRRYHVLRIHPPLDGEVEAKLDSTREGNHYPPEGPQPVHFRPKEFVEDSVPSAPNREIAKSTARRQTPDQATEDEICEYAAGLYEIEFSHWESRTRENLVDTLVADDRYPHEYDFSIPVTYTEDTE